MAQDSNAPVGTPTTTADVANAKNRNLSLSEVAKALGNNSASVITALGDIATAITQKMLGGVVGTTTNRLLRAKTVSSGSSAGSVQNSTVGCDDSGNLTGIADLNMSGTLTAATLNPTNALTIPHGGTSNTTAAAAFDALAPTTTQGDIIYRNATTNTRLAAGTSGQFLQTQGAGANPQWADAAFGKTTLASGNLAAANVGATITSIAATYSYLILQVTGASTDTDTRTLWVQVSTNNGVSYDTTIANYNGEYFTNAGGFTSFVTNSAPTLTWGVRNLAATTVDATIVIWGYQGGMYPWSSGVQKPSTGSPVGVMSSYVGSTSAINALRIIIDGTGNFDAGSYVLYGVR